MARPKKEQVSNICKLCNKEFFTLLSKTRQFCSGPCAQQFKGVDKTWMEKRKKTCLEKYGNEIAFKSKEVQDTYKNNLRKKYGVENPFLVPEFKEKSDNTIQERYNVPVAMMNKDIADKVSISLKNKPKDRINFVNIKWEKIVKYCEQTNLIPLFDKKTLLDNKLTFYEDNKFGFKCKLCNNTSTVSLANGYLPSCDCSDNKGYSIIEEEIYTFINKLLPKNVIQLRNKDILPNRLELDILIPELNIAFEINGIYWHSESMGKYKDYHLYKTNHCNEKNIQLIHIFDYEWIYKKPILESIIRSKLGKITNKIYARKCIIKPIIDTSVLRTFLNNNHIQGYCYSKVNLGLYYNNELVSVMTFGKNRFQKNSNQMELVRFCNKLNHMIVGGASKLFSHFVKNHLNIEEEIITFADRRFSEGNLYKQLGFVFDKNTSPSYFYWKNSNILNRMSCQKHKLNKLLPIFDNNISEYENMLANKYRRVWDCGNKKYVFKKKSD
jgi:hypothetical protein